MYSGEEIGLAVILAGIVVWIFHRIRKARKIAIRFFQENDIHIITINHRVFVPLSLLLTTSSFQVWFYAQLLNENGGIKEVYVKVGHWLAGLLEPIVQVFQIDD